MKHLPPEPTVGCYHGDTALYLWLTVFILHRVTLGRCTVVDYSLVTLL